MADLNTTNNQGNDSNQTMQREQGKAEVSGGSDRMREQGGMDKKSEEKSAIGGQCEERRHVQGQERQRGRQEP